MIPPDGFPNRMRDGEVVLRFRLAPFATKRGEMHIDSVEFDSDGRNRTVDGGMRIALSIAYIVGESLRSGVPLEFWDE